MKRILGLSLCCLAALAVSSAAPTTAYSADEKVDEAAVKRARKTVQMLDGVYKNAVVLITDKYVNTKKDFPAGRAAIKWFADISKGGTHEVRLIDVSGEPYSPKNVARDAFEKEGVKQLQAGKGYYEKVEYKGGKAYLRAITAVPVVMPKCVMCHDNYKSVKKGAAVGALTYVMPID